MYPTNEYLRVTFSHCGLSMVAITLTDRSDTEVYAVNADGLEVFLGYSHALCTLLRDAAESAHTAAWLTRRKAYLDAAEAADEDEDAVPETCEDNGGDDSNHCHECLECLERLEKDLKRAMRGADFCDESDRMACILDEQVTELKAQLGVA